MAFKFVCQDKQFKYSRLVDEEAVPEDVKRLVLEMYQHLTGLNSLDHVDDEHAGICKEINRKRRGENVEPGNWSEFQCGRRLLNIVAQVFDPPGPLHRLGRHGGRARGVLVARACATPTHSANL